MGIDYNEISSKSNGGTELMARELEQRLEPELMNEVQIIPSRMRELDPTKIRIFWLHDLPRDPESDNALKEGGWKRFHKIIAVSNWQMQAYASHYEIPWSKFEVIQNAIVPIVSPEIVAKRNRTETIELIYTSTPHRGLHLLAPVFNKLCEQRDDLHLTVYSSFKLYGWDDQDAKYEPVFDMLRSNPKVTLVQGAPNSEVREAVARAHIFAYPSIWMETSCLCLIEAMSAGCLCVHPNYGALYETAANWTVMYQWNEDANAHANEFSAVLKVAIEGLTTRDSWVHAHLDQQKVYADLIYSWDLRIAEWRDVIKGLLHQPREIAETIEYWTYRA